MMRSRVVILNTLQRRFASTFRVAVIGSGPAAFYTAYHLISKKPGAKVDFFEKLPVPYGLARFGVAPDHPEVKNCQEKFEEVATNENVSFYGNVEVGKDVELKQLKENYNAVIFAYGCSEDNELRIPGGNSDGVISARRFVGWYNGLPEHQDLSPPLDKVEDVVIIGNGNVALDVARVLLAPVDHWKNTDITENALDTLKKSTVKKVTIVGRRGFFESAFTNKELRELLELNKFGVKFDGIEERFVEDLRPLVSQLNRIDKRRLQIVDKFKNSQPETYTKQWKLDYLKSPIEVYVNNGDPELLSATEFNENRLVQRGIDERTSCEATGRTTTLKNELLITSIGYKGQPLKGMEEVGIVFDDRKGIIPNIDGKVINPETKEWSTGFYASGWIRRGATGVIASTMMDSFTTAEYILKDLEEGLYLEEKSGFSGLRLQNYVSWSDWTKIEKKELEQGAVDGKIREKITNLETMLEIAAR